MSEQTAAHDAITEEKDMAEERAKPQHEDAEESPLQFLTYVQGSIKDLREEILAKKGLFENPGYLLIAENNMAEGSAAIEKMIEELHASE